MREIWLLCIYWFLIDEKFLFISSYIYVIYIRFIINKNDKFFIKIKAETKRTKLKCARKSDWVF
jgi:hypothetical protein